MALACAIKRVDLALDPCVLQFDVLLLVQPGDLALAFGDGPFLLRLHMLGGEDDLGFRLFLLGLFRRFFGAAPRKLDIIGDLRFLERQHRLHLDPAKRLVAGDLCRLGFAFLVDPRGFGGQARFGSRLVRARLGIGFEFGEVLALGDLRFLLGFLDFQLPLMLCQPAFADGDLGCRFDRNPGLALFGDHFRQPAHALGLEGVVLVMLGEGGLINRDQRRRYELQTEPGGTFGHRFGNLIGKAATVDMDIVEAAAGGGVLHRVDQDAGHQIMGCFAGAGYPGAERLCGIRNAVLRRLDFELELHFDVGAQLVLAHRRLASAAADRDHDRGHGNFLQPMEDGESEAAAVDDHFTAAHAGAHQGGFERRLGVVAMQKPRPQHDRDSQQKKCREPDHHSLPNPGSDGG